MVDQIDFSGGWLLGGVGREREAAPSEIYTGTRAARGDRESRE